MTTHSPTVETEPTPPVEALMPLLRFTAADLAANQHGTLSAAQLDRLNTLKTRLLMIGGGSFFGLALLATGFMYGGQTNDTPILGFVGVLFTVLNAIVIGMFGRQLMRLNADARDNATETLSGNLERVVRANRSANNFVLRVQNTDFEVDKETFKAFRHEQPYRFYRTPHAKILLSAEPVV